MKNHDLNVFLYDSSAPIGNSYHGCAAERYAGMYLSVHPGMFISMFGYLKQLQRSKVTAVQIRSADVDLFTGNSVFFQPCAAKRQKYPGKSGINRSLHACYQEWEFSFFFLIFWNVFGQNWHIQQFHSDINFIQDNIQHFLFLNSHFCVCNCPVPLCGVY